MLFMSDKLNRAARCTVTLVARVHIDMTLRAHVEVNIDSWRGPVRSYPQLLAVESVSVDDFSGN